MSKTIGGHLAKIYIDDRLVGLFQNFDWSGGIGMEPVWILGAELVQEFGETHVEPVSFNASGWRIMNNGVHVLPKYPKVQDLIGLGEFKIDVLNRETGQPIATILRCKWNRYGAGVSSQSLTRVNLSGVGIILQDESGDQGAGPGAASLPE